MNPKIKAELHSALVTFLSTFILIVAPLFAEHLQNEQTITSAVLISIVTAGARAAFKAVYQMLITEYHVGPANTTGK